MPVKENFSGECKEYYDVVSHGYNELHRAEQEKKLRVIASSIGLEKECVVVDVGCGTGAAAMFFPGCKYIGLDISAGMIEEGKKALLQKREAPFLLLLGDLERIPLKSNSADAVICVTAIHHAKNIQQSLEEMKRVSKKWVCLSLLERSRSFQETLSIIEKLFNVLRIVRSGPDAVVISKKREQSGRHKRVFQDHS